MPKTDSFFTIKVPWKLITAIVAAVLGGGGTYWALDFYTRAEVDLKIENSQKALRDHSHKRAQQLESKVEKNTHKIDNVEHTVERIQSVQIKDISRAEARRVTAGIRSRQAREQAYDRLVDRNVKRLKKGADPCSTVACE
jgi:hypothetical protein